MVTQNELMIVTGQLLVFTLNAVIGNTMERPRWYASKGEFGDAFNILKKVREEK
ncbi:MFS transporter, SP family, major inositol transporter [Alteribacillus bidgolensis]|uniref:MFS transporter, SP family, major inositol transporter n=1 Tax=Alteribacillus bidgolensis TaxID=930129 RepID=A0A1G8K9Y5_9BACI|nr:MFS transporter, SP family, major inositol transporter [Alteribacillus bidgolensis]